MTLLKSGYNTLKKLADTAGYNLVVTKKVKISAGHEADIPLATYAPWSQDEPFNEAYKIIKKYTLVDKLRCYELWQLVKETAKLDGALIEVGAWRGGSGALIAKQAKLCGIKDIVYLCDTFTGVVKAGERDSNYKGGEHADTSKQDVEEVLGKLMLDNTLILVGIFPEETSKFITDNIFRFCHIDVDVYQSAKDSLECVWPKLVTGGIVVFDDYGFQFSDGVTQFVNEERNKKDRLVIHNLNGHAILVKISD